MIAFIQGELCDAGQDTIVVACHGIGYEIQIPVSVAQVLQGMLLRYIRILM